ncbi:isochorismate synthase [Lyngbya confervoides BDU141951]|uniref:Isochorismate synthase n=1 Tax=Lyngbya confervoides BDU141951 TaxID=1574623 RepID=A0ABD4T8Y3_9CYAN|nr:isochorismate synthase [Lyngbya confervoides]MCM1984943.1 isochorismate synthase [Lyngbya confervoides BDU141951]
MSELQQKPGFFSALAAAVFKIFSPPHDDYPVTGVQPFSGDPNPNP